MHYVTIKGEIPQNHQRLFALFDPFKIGNLTTPI